MGIADNTVGLIFSIRAESDQAKKEISDFRATVKKETDAISTDGKSVFTDLAKSIGLSAEQTAKLGAALPVVGAAIAAVAGAAAGAAVGLFALAKNASDYGSEIFDASKKTGLSAETLSSLKVAADQSGSSLQDVSGAVTKFSRLVAEAASGSEDAANKLKRLGIQPKEAIADLDGSLGKVFARIQSLPPGIQQMTAAQDAFGKSGASLIPVIDSFDGNLEKLKQTAKELGVTLTDADAAAADEFGDSLDLVSTVAGGLGNQFARQFAPQITAAMQDITKYLKDNQTAASQWGTYVGNILAGMRTQYLETANYFKDNPIILKVAYYAAGGSLQLVQTVGGYFAEKGKQAAPAPAAAPTISPNVPPTPPPDESYLDGQKAEFEKLKKEREAYEKSESAASIALIEQQRKRIGDVYEENKEKEIALRKEGKATIETLGDAVGKLGENYSRELSSLLKLLRDLKSADKTPTEKIVITDAINDDALKTIKKLQEDTDAARKLEVELQKKAIDETQKNREEASQQNLRLSQEEQRELELRLKAHLERGEITEAEYIQRKANLNNAFLAERQAGLERDLDFVEKGSKREQELLNEIAVLDAQIRVNRIETEVDVQGAQRKTYEDAADWLEKELELIQKKKDAAIAAAKEQAENEESIRRQAQRQAEDEDYAQTSGGLLGGLLTGIGSSALDAKSKLEPLKEVGEMLSQVFGQVANAVGSAVSAFVKFGTAGGSFRKFVAEVLASVASMAAVKAIFELAEGFAALALAYFGIPNAGPSATAHFAAAAIYGSIAGVAAVAGRAVAGNAFQSASNQGATAGNSNNSNNSSNSNSNDPRIIERDRNQPPRQELLIRFAPSEGFIKNTVLEDIGNNGDLRSIIIKTANES